MPQYLCQQCWGPQGQPQSLPTSQRPPPRPTGRSGPGSEKVTASALGAGACETLYAPSKIGVSISLSPVEPQKFRPKCSRCSPFRCQIPRVGSLTWSSELLLLVGELLQYNYSPVYRLSTWGVWDLIISRVCLSYRLVVAPLPLDVKYLFGRNQSFSLMIVQQWGVILVCSWEGMNSRSFYCAILSLIL